MRALVALDLNIQTRRLVRNAFAFSAAFIAFLLLSGTALAQQSSDDQYAIPTAPSGPAADAQCEVSGDTNGVVNAGDVITCAGDFAVADGASVVLQDADATQGTFIDGENAEITEGSLVISVTGEPYNVAGGNGVLNTEGLFVVATTGVSEASDDSGAAVGTSGGDSAGGSSVASSVVGVLPDTGGFAFIGVISAVMLVGVALVGFRSRLRKS